MTGFHRTGTFLASEQCSPAPDLICLSKGLTGGTLPMSITTCTASIFDAFRSNDSSRTFFHGHSYTGNPVGCAAALASIDLLEKPECQQAIQVLCASQARFVEELRKDFPRLNARAQGTIFAADLPGEGYLDPIGPKLYRQFLEQGCLIRPLGNTVYLMPPYCINREQLEKLQTALRQSIKNLF
jgi:adenosylmethionine-8-amino-7-oxononanoate aminotransferase